MSDPLKVPRRTSILIILDGFGIASSKARAGRGGHDRGPMTV